MNPILIVLKGMAMGMAEIIPGVSGGTIAFVTGIYERFINCIKAFSPALFGVWRKEGFGAVWKAIDGNFLVFLLGGMGVGIVVGTFGITYLLEHYPIPLWAFFFGLIFASAIYIARQTPNWSVGEWIALVVGTVSAYGITILPMGQGSESLVMVFFSGLIAISALLLPGISGSFILLLLGMYSFIIPTLKKALKTFDSEALLILGVFATGCLIGLVTFARVLSWLFKNYKSLTFATMTGFLLGSLNKIWPWRVPKDIINITKSDGTIEEKIVTESNLLPSTFAMETGEASYLIAAIGTFIAGLLIVLILEKMGSKQESH